MPRLINFEGRQISVPDDATDQEVANIINATNAPVTPSTPAPTQGTGSTELLATAPATGDQPAKVVIGTNPQPAPSLAHNLAVGAQGVGAGLRDVVLAPFDLAAGAQNLVTRGINAAAGTDIPTATPASQIVDNVTEPFTIPESQMSPKEKLAYNINRFGTQALGAGTALASRAPAVAAQAVPSDSVLGRIFDTMAGQYIANAPRTVTGDVIGGVGAGAANNAAQEYLPDEPVTPLGQVAKGAAQFIAPLLGAVGANGLQTVGEGLGGAIRNLLNRRTDVNLPVRGPGQTYSMADSERAARELQSRVSGAPAVVAQDIRENAADLTNPTAPGTTPIEPSQLPTSGLLSGDPGLVTAETGARTRQPADFITRDQNVKEAAASRVSGLQDTGADQGAVATAAQSRRDAMIGEKTSQLADAEALERRFGNIREEQAATLAPIVSSDTRANASRNLDRAVVDQGYVPARAEKNRQFDVAPGRTEELPADDVIAAAQRVRQNINQLGPVAQQLPAEFVQRLEALAPNIQENTVASRIIGADGQPITRTEQVNTGGPGTANGGDLADLRKYISTAREAAQRSGNFELADNIGTLGQAINRTIENAPGYAEANANYRQFAQTYRPERGDEAAKFTRELDRAGNTDGMPNRGSTPPSETAGRFLSSPEKAAALQRLIDASPNAAAGNTAVRDYLRSDFATSALNPDGTINLRRAVQWLRNNADILSRFPNVGRELDEFVSNAREGAAGHATAEARLTEMSKSLRATESELDRGAVGTLLREDPRDVASRILNGGYGSEKQLDEINNVVKSDPSAARGWKAAVSEVLTDRVSSARKVGESYEVQYARLSKEFKDNENVLAKVYSPEEMNTLRQAHKLLGYFKEAEKRATAGSNTADKAAIPGWIQLAARHFYGDLRGGGIIKRFKLLLDLIPTNRQSAEEIVNMAWFQPNVAAYLLERPIKNYYVPQYNINLRRLIAADNAARGD